MAILNTTDIEAIDLIQVDGIDEIPIKASVVIDNDNYGRLDLICLKYYRSTIPLKQLLDFNRITDPINIKLGTVIKVPDIEFLNMSSSIVEDTTSIPGVSESPDNSLINQSKTKASKNLKTMASPKLKISLPAVSVNEATGTITF